MGRRARRAAPDRSRGLGSALHERRRADRAEAEWRGAFRHRRPGVHRRVRARRRARVPDRGVPHGGVVLRPDARRDLCHDGCDGGERRHRRPRNPARSPCRGQALDGRRRRQDHDRGRAGRRRVRRSVREDERARARPHGRHARQARVHPRLSRRADDRRAGRADTRDRNRCRRANRRPRAGRQEALRAARRDGDDRPGLADRGEHHVQEDRRRRERRRPRRQGRGGCIHADG